VQVQSPTGASATQIGGGKAPDLTSQVPLASTSTTAPEGEDKFASSFELVAAHHLISV